MNKALRHVRESPECCELCGRAGAEITTHHLIPRMRHRHKRTRRSFHRDDMRTRVLRVCRPCHEHIHAVFNEKELAYDYNRREALLTHPDIRRFVAWIKERPAGLAAASRTMKRKARRR